MSDAPDRLDALAAGIAVALRSPLEWLDGQEWFWRYVARRLAGTWTPPPPPPPPGGLDLVPILGPWRDLPADFTPDRSRTTLSPRTGRLIMAFDLRDDQSVVASVAFTNRRGNPAPVDAPDWTTDNIQVLVLEPLPPDPDRPHVAACRIAPVGPLGTATVTLRADADPGDGVREIVASGEVRVTAGGAIHAELTFEAPQDLPAEDEADGGTAGTGTGGLDADAAG